MTLPASRLPSRDEGGWMVKPGKPDKSEKDTAALIKNAQIVPPSQALDLARDPEVAEALRLTRDTEEEDGGNPEEAEAEADATFDELEGYAAQAEHPIANGTTVPFPYVDDDPGKSSCSLGTLSNRGCNQFKRCPLGMRWAKRKKRAIGAGGAGPVMIVFKNLRSGRMHANDCRHFLQNNSHDLRNRILPGVGWVPTLLPQYENLPNGQQPMPGPGQPKPPIRLVPVKNPVPCLIETEDAIEYEKLRRRGEVV